MDGQQSWVAGEPRGSRSCWGEVGPTVGAVVTDNGVLQVICTRDNAKPMIIRECSDWTAYTVRRAGHEGE